MLLSLNLGPAETAFADELGDLARCVAGNAAWLPTIRTRGFIESSETFVRRYELIYGTTPSYFAAGGFGAVELVAEAIEAAIDSGRGVEPRRDPRPALLNGDRDGARPLPGASAGARTGRRAAGAEGAPGAVAGRWGGGLVRRIVHPEAVADAEVCLGG